MIDIHSHILPGIDDGAKSIEDSLAMARQAFNQGITKVVASPHNKNGTFDNAKSAILTDVQLLNKALQQEGIELKILPGQENRIYGELVEELTQGDLLTVNENGVYMLIEFPSSHLPRYANKILFDLQVQGIVPIIVHPERNREIMENPERLYNLVKEGALSQLTGTSVTGKMGKKIQKFSFDLIQSNLTHFIASDAHNTKARPFDLGEALETVEKEFGISTRYMLQENAEDMIMGRMVAKEVPQQVRKKKILGLF
ncbi:tyrosine protein phosphatase [Bacillus hwajinpoensis]|uniref:Tyrosine-protein phosphatase n=1 Tax=Guptibacillus hwajinpoensis TaxID=208199 RepID=A0A845ER56_9BACL|nr:CpsB/CapC family capsule biosynthesis tyrosine phosphatase [Pseudalkalibacillus hwajinpoensis]MYL62254.1 tyrosine protein phosphatase [Pseudalkalibacillus hwajinpoensis]